MMDSLRAWAWREIAAQWRDLQRRVTFWQPALDVPPWAAPAVALGALLALALVSGVAVLSLGALLVALVAAQLLLEHVFGVSVLLTPSR